MHTHSGRNCVALGKGFLSPLPAGITSIPKRLQESGTRRASFTIQTAQYGALKKKKNETIMQY